jgi:hypothetical protein
MDNNKQDNDPVSKPAASVGNDQEFPSSESDFTAHPPLKKLYCSIELVREAPSAATRALSQA